MSSRTDESARALQWSDILLREVTLTVHVRVTKTDQFGKGRAVCLDACADSALCPVGAVEQYMAVRGLEPGFFFQHEDRVPLTLYQFWVIMARALDNIGLKDGHFGTHSFCIGAASTAAQMGYPDTSIKSIGGWKSGAF